MKIQIDNYLIVQNQVGNNVTLHFHISLQRCQIMDWGSNYFTVWFPTHNNDIYHVYNFYDIKHHYEARGGGKLVCGKINQFERENIVYHSLTLHVYIQHFELNHIYVHAKKISHKMSFQNVNDV